MARPICYECGRRLMYVNGKPSFATWTDPIGNEHKMHKGCIKTGGYDTKGVTAQPIGEVMPLNIGAYVKKGGA